MGKKCGDPKRTPKKKTCHLTPNASKQGRHRLFGLMWSLGLSREASWSEARDGDARIPVSVVDIGQQKPVSKKKIHEN